ncbi:hypothetical protein JCM3774_000797 [Rhodotorula dairenensis]
MPVLSAAAYDSILLEKVKLVIQAVLQDPKTPPTTFEDFVVGFDVAQPLAYKLFDLLIQETTKRRPRKVNVEPAAAVASTSSASLPTGRRTRTARAHSPDPIDMLMTRPERTHRLADVVANQEDDEEGGASVPSRQRRLSYGFESFLVSRVAAAANADVSPSTRLRQRQLEELFGPPRPNGDPLPDYLLDLLDHDDDNDDGDDHDNDGVLRTGRRSAQFAPAVPRPSALLDGVPLPTHEELWSMLVDDQFPDEARSSYFGFRMALNSTPTFAAAPVRAPSLTDLIDELADRDLAFPIRLSNLLAARSGEDDSVRGTGVRTVGDDAMRGTDAAPAEGIWRASFIEHLDDGTTREVPVRLGTNADGSAAGPSSRRTDGPAFAAFAERRRAERRSRRDGQAAPETGSITGDAMSLDSPADASSTSGENPLVTVSHASTPATSAAHSPAVAAPELCPPIQPQPPPRPAVAAPTSASLAEAHFRSQRAIAPLPSARVLEATLPPPAIPYDVLVRVRESVDAGRLQYDPPNGWSGPAVPDFTADQLDVVARTLMQIHRVAIGGTNHGHVDIEF